MQRLSKQRERLLNNLQCRHDHPTACQLYDSVKKDLPKISLGTVYRNLKLLCRAGLIREIPVKGEPSHFDADIDRHYHLRCLKCGKISDVSTDCISVEISMKTDGCCVTNCVVSLEGYCEACIGEGGCDN
jgi:Fe2+ or Zn2+ uptake regulation protein